MSDTDKPETVEFQDAARYLARCASISLQDARHALNENPELLEKVVSARCDCDQKIQEFLKSKKEPEKSTGK